jgi:hypothetical protein
MAWLVLCGAVRILKQRNDGTDRMLLPKREKAEQTLKRVLAVWKTEKPEKLDAFNAYGSDKLLCAGGVLHVSYHVRR